jgi:hypothetical protein
LWHDPERFLQAQSLTIDGSRNPVVLPQVRAGAINAYAVTASRRLAAAPDIPTVDQAGFPGLYLSVWFGFWAPARTRTTVEALADPAVRARLNDLAQEIFPREQQTPEALAALQKAETDKMVADHPGGRHQGRMKVPSDKSAGRSLPRWLEIACGEGWSVRVGIK